MVVTVALEERMRLDVNDEDEVAVRAAVRRRCALPLDADAAAVLHAGRDFDVDRLESAVAVDLERERRPARGLREGEPEALHGSFSIQNSLEHLSA